MMGRFSLPYFNAESSLTISTLQPRVARLSIVSPYYNLLPYTLANLVFKNSIHRPYINSQDFYSTILTLNSI